MFDVNFEDTDNLIAEESRMNQMGNALAEPCFSPVGYLGLSISYDLRFPELYRQMILRGAQVLLVPSAFLSKTGSSHWETLIRTRAIENQCYVVASAQISDHNNQNAVGFGHSMVVDPWGDIVAQCSNTEGVALCELDMDYLNNVRSHMNCLTHIRTDKIFKKVNEWDQDLKNNVIRSRIERREN